MRRAAKRRACGGAMLVSLVLAACVDIGGGGGGGPAEQPRPRRPAYSPTPVPGDAAARGELLFQAQGCVLCHGAAGAGGVPNANSESGGLINGLTLVKEGYTEPQLEKRIREGAPEVGRKDAAGPVPPLRMPAYGRYLRDDQVKDLAAYLFSLYPADRESLDDDWDDEPETPPAPEAETPPAPEAEAPPAPEADVP